MREEWIAWALRVLSVAALTFATVQVTVEVAREAARDEVRQVIECSQSVLAGELGAVRLRFEPPTDMAAPQ